MNENELEGIKTWLSDQIDEQGDPTLPGTANIFFKMLIKEVDDLRALVRKERQEFNEERKGKRQEGSDADKRLYQLTEENRNLRVLLNSASPKDCFADVVDPDEDWCTPTQARDETRETRDKQFARLVELCGPTGYVVDPDPGMEPSEWLVTVRNALVPRKVTAHCLLVGPSGELEAMRDGVTVGCFAPGEWIRYEKALEIEVCGS